MDSVSVYYLSQLVKTVSELINLQVEDLCDFTSILISFEYLELLVFLMLVISEFLGRDRNLYTQ